MKYLNCLLLFIPLSIILRFLHTSESMVFITVCLSIVPLAGIIGNATEQISIYTGSKIGGLINATMSNIPELLIGFFAVKAGYYSLVLASMAGSIIGNLLLVLGFSILLGGMKHKYQTFNKSIARSNFVLLFFAALSIIIPFTLKYGIHSGGNPDSALLAISFSIALTLLVTYISGLIFSFITHRNVFVMHEEQEERQEKARWSLSRSVFLLILSAIFVAVESEMLVDTLENAISTFGFPEVFIGIVLVPILGNVAENVSAILMAIKNKIDISLEIAIGSSIQIALFVAPILILVSFLLGKPMTYVYDVLEVVAMLAAIGLSLYVFQDGKTNWLEGLVLIGCYIMLGISFIFV